MDARTNVMTIFSVLVLLASASAALAASPPTAPQTLTQGTTSTFSSSNYPAQQTDALAGNITQLTLTSISQTRSWQGYWGNVSGTIVLNDANNYTFYNWSAAEPRGYIYATLVSHGTPSWLNVQCFTFAGNASAFDTYYNISASDYDNVTITYNTTLPREIYIVNNSFNNCPTTYINQNDDYQSSNFINYLMWDSSGGNDAWVFGTIIEEKDDSPTKADKVCYNNELCDFQLLVAENGHGTDISVTPYYFWVDITG